MRSLAIWAAFGAAVLLPFGIAATSPLLQWRDPIYIAAGFAGVIALALLLLQPLLMGGRLPGLQGPTGRRLHRYAGTLLILCVILHVGGLWITSPPDVIDALLFVSPTPFSNWGVIAMWALFAAALFIALRHRIPARVWRPAHTALVTLTVVTTALHALLIQGTMGQISKAILCALILAATAKVIADRRIWTRLKQKGGPTEPPS